MVWIRSLNKQQLIDCKCLVIHDNGRTWDIREHTQHGIYTMGTYLNQQEVENVLELINNTLCEHLDKRKAMQMPTSKEIQGY